MRKSLIPLLLGALFLSATQTPAAVRYDRLFYEITEQVVTPHVEWGKPLAGGPVRLLVIGPRISMREVVELSQRFDVEHEEVMTWDAGKLGSRPTERMYNQAEGAMVEDVAADLRDGLARPHDVIVVGNVQWAILPEDVRAEILRQTRAGTGLVYAHPPAGWVSGAGLDDARPVVDANAFLSRGIPFDALTAFHGLRGSSDPVSEFADLYSLGEGRLAVLAYPRASRVVCLTAAPTARGRHHEMEYEYLQSFAMKAILWAARREPEVLIGELSVQRSRLRVELLSQADDVPVEIRWAVRDDLTPLAEGVLTATLKRGGNRFQVSVPRLPAGTHLADVIVAADGADVNWGSTMFAVETAFGIDSVAVAKPYYEHGETIGGQVRLRGTVPGDAELRLRLVDHTGRVLGRREGAAEVTDFAFELAEPLSSVYRVEADLWAAGGLVESRFAEVPVRRRNRNDFTFWVWPGGGSAFDRTTRTVLERMAEIGVDGVSNVYPRNVEYLRNFARHNFHFIPYMSRYYYGGRDPDTTGARIPCLTDPVYRAREAEHLREYARAFAPYGPPLYSLGDENELGPDDNDICFSETCVLDFRVYLQQRYADLKALNAEWGTSYTSWDEVTPIRLEDARASGQLPRWTDHRLHMEKVFLDMHRFGTQTIREIDPAAKVGFDGAWYTSSWVGYDFWDLMNELDFLGTYFPPEQIEQMRSFKRPGMSIGTWYGGYVWGGFGAYGHFRYAPQRTEAFQRYWPWHLLLHGADGAWWFIAHSANESGIAPDLSFFPIFRHTMEEVNEIKGGIARLLLDAERVDDGIALHYSQTNTHASTIEHRLTSSEASQRSFIKLLEDQGYQYRYLAAPQIAGGLLESGGYRLLILPYAQSLSAAESTAIERWVQAGGIVLADLRPGVYDEHLRARRRGSLDRLFGIERRDVAWTQHVRAGLAGDGLSDLLPGAKVDPAVRLKGGEALMQRGDVPLWVTRQVGEGRALLLNFALDPYFELRKEAREEPFGDLLRTVLGDLGIRPRVRVQDDTGQRLRAQEVVAFRDGELEYVAVKRDAEVVGTESLRMNAIFGRRAHVYDMRGGSYLGYGRRARTVLSPMTPQLFALLPYHVESLAVELDAESYGQGDRVTARVRLQTSTGAVGDHAIRLEVLAPDGQVSRLLSRTLSTTAGAAEGTVSLAWNDPTGRWTVRARDVATGTTATVGFDVAAE